MEYQKMYCYLVGQIDDVLEMMGDLDIMPLGPIRERLKTALLTAEEMYIEQDENRD